MRLLLVLFAALPELLRAQFLGGGGSGGVMVPILPSSIPISMFSGSAGRGDMTASIVPASIISDLFSGSNGRGDVSASITASPVPSNRYSGGGGRGDVNASIAASPVFSNLYGGGIGRGEITVSIAATPVLSSIYNGGSGRGDLTASIASAPVLSNLFTGGDGRGDRMTGFDPRQVPLLLKGFLDGPYVTATGLMNDALRGSGIFPTTEPYTGLGYMHLGGGGATIQPSVLTTSGNNAIVDWVVVELRDTINPATVLATRSALIQRDGDIVSTDGSSPVTFSLKADRYFIALRHRNHLGVMTGTSLALNNTGNLIDFSTPATLTYGTSARKSITGTFPTQALWAGDVTFNGQVKYTGSGNDRDPILIAVGSTTPNNVISTYSTRDVNLNGQVKYTGSGNDRDPILVNVGSTTPNNIRVQQLP